MTSTQNPILIETRRHLEGHKRPHVMLAVMLRWIDDPTASREDERPWTDEQRDHARRVLTRVLAVWA